MRLDTKGLDALSKFLVEAELNINVPIPVPDPGFNSELSSRNPMSPKHENKMSCSLCGIFIFDSLEEFKAHRQSSEHLSKLNRSIDINGPNSNSDYTFNENIVNSQGSSSFEIHSNMYKLFCFKALLAARDDPEYTHSILKLEVDLLKKLILLQKSHIMIVLNGGGYFAAAIFSNEKRSIICSKTFKRYTSRRAQGGSQSIKDNSSGGKIHSAGAIIRRENEKRLREEIEDLFKTWKPEIDQCRLIFSNRDLFITEILQKDQILRCIPFTTYQACLDEINRCYNELISSIKIEKL